MFLVAGCGSIDKGNIAIIDIEGVIEPSLTKRVLEDLENVSKDKSVKAVVVRVESPGGAVASSQEIYSTIKKLNDKKVVVVSMGSMAASGGYYVSLGANKIFANPGTATGSIGVRFDHYYLGQLMNKVGVGSEIMKTGFFKDISPIARAWNEEEKHYIKALLNELKIQFVSTIAEERKLPYKHVDLLADGRVFTGEMAKKYRLIDEIGTEFDAVSEAAKLAGIKGEPKSFRIKPKKSFVKSLFEESKILVDMIFSSNSSFSWRQ